MSDEDDGSAGCVSYAGSPAVTAQPARVVSTMSLGWAAGAISIDRLDGMVKLSFEQPRAINAGFVGLVHDEPGCRFPENVPYAFMFNGNSTTGIDVYSIMERGTIVHGPISRAAGFDETFEILRYANGAILYRVNGIEVYVSTVYSDGSLIAVGAPYASGDSLT